MNDIKISDLLKRWKVIVLVFAIFLIASSVVYLVLPKNYESEMKILVKNDRALLVVTPGNGNDDSSNRNQDVSESIVNSEVDLLKSKDLLRSVVVDAKLYEPYNKNSRDIERATTALSKKLKIDTARKSDVIDITYKNSDPDLAAFVLNNLGEKFMNSHVAAHSNPGTYNFFEVQADKFHTELIQARTLLAAFRNKTGLFSFYQQRQAVVSEYEDSNKQMNDLTLQIKECETRLGASTDEIKAMPSRITTSNRDLPNQITLQHLQTTLTDMANQRIALLNKYQSTDRHVVELDNQIKNTTADLARLQSSVAREETTNVNTVHLALQTDIVRDTATLAGLRAKQAALLGIIQNYRTKLDDIGTQAVALQDYETKEQLASDNYKLYSTRVEEARLSESLDLKKIGNVKIVEQPVPSFAPTPSMMAFVLGGGTIGLFLALCYAVVLELRYPPRATLLQITKGIPERNEGPAFGD
jgi:uncharacterized protein involved in exopolysaccharide biosynthesis